MPNILRELPITHHSKSRVQRHHSLPDTNKGQLVKKIQSVIIHMICYQDDLPDLNYSCYISETMNYDYTYLSNIFSEVTFTTIQHFIIVQKIERVKELLLFDKLSLKEISYKLNYSSLAHLSNQFKKVTGTTSSHFKQSQNFRFVAKRICE